MPGDERGPLIRPVREESDGTISQIGQALTSRRVATPAVEYLTRTLSLQSIDGLPLPYAKVPLSESRRGLYGEVAARRLEGELCGVSCALKIGAQDALKRWKGRKFLPGCASLIDAKCSECHILMPREDASPIGLTLSVTQEDPETHFAGAAARDFPPPRVLFRVDFALGSSVPRRANSPEASAPRMRSSATNSIAVSGRELRRRSTS